MAVQDMTMTCPPGWQDKSMLIFSAPAAGASGVIPNLVVTRDRMPPDLPADPVARMTMLADRQVGQMREQLARFEEVARRIERDVAEIKVDWASAQAALTQTVTLVDAGEGVMMIATATAGRGDFAEHEQAFREMLKSFRAG